MDELRALDERAGDKYLEHVVIVKKSTVSRHSLRPEEKREISKLIRRYSSGNQDRVLHTSMAVRYVDVLCRYLKDPVVEKEFADAGPSQPTPSPPIHNVLLG